MAMYPYMTLNDETEIVHSHLIKKDGLKIVEVHFERPVYGGFDSVRCTLPTYEWTVWEGKFSDEEIKKFEIFIKNNAHLLYKYAESGGINFADSLSS